MDLRPGMRIPGPDGTEAEILEGIGGGGYAYVYRGQLSNGQLVAIKTVFTIGLSDIELRALVNEAEVAAQLRHPNITEVLYSNDGTESQYSPYLIMEYVDGGDLAQTIAQLAADGAKLSEQELLAYYKQIATGMHYVFASGLLHRDLKPANILCDRGTAALKIADFGLAKRASANTRTHTLKGFGTEAYIAPEAFDQEKNTVSMDIYSAGVIFFELATLSLPIEPPVGDKSPMRWQRATWEDAPKQLCALRPDLNMALGHLVGQMLEKDPRKRPESWEAVLKRLDSEPTNKILPNVDRLVQREALARAERARKAEENAKAGALHQVRSAAFRDASKELLQPLIDVLEALDAAGITNLKLQVSADAMGSQAAYLSAGAIRARVTGARNGRTLTLVTRLVQDRKLFGLGIVRGIAEIATDVPVQPRDRNTDPEGMAGFNAAYLVRSGEDFGQWVLFSFEMNPLRYASVDPHWFHRPLSDFEMRLPSISASGDYQIRRSHIDPGWYVKILDNLIPME